MEAALAREPGRPGFKKGLHFASRVMIATAFAILALHGVAITAADASPSSTIVLRDEQTDYDLSTVASRLEDPSGELDIDEVSRRSDFHRDAPSIAERSRRSSVWLRFSVSENATRAIGWYLWTSNSCLSADLYEPDPRGGFDHHSFGWSVPFAKHPYPGADVAIALDKNATSGRSAYLRLDCPSELPLAGISSTSSLNVGWIDDIVPESFAPELILFAFGVLGIVFAALTRGRIYLLSAGPPLALTLLVSFQTGQLSRAFPAWPMPPWHVSRVCITIVFFLAQWLFFREFLEMRVRMRFPDRLLVIALFVLLVQTILPFSGGPRNHIFFAAGEVAFYIIPLIAAANAWRNGSRRAGFFVAGLSMVAIGYALINLHAGGIDLVPLAFATWLDDWNVPFESLMLFAGIADQFRQTLLANQEALAQSDFAKTALLQAQREHIVEIERRNTSFSRFVPKEFLEQLARTDIADVQLGDHSEQAMSILFSDIRRFTTIVETLTPAEIFAFLNSYLEHAGPAIRQNAGFIDKYIGDAIMALFPRNPTDAVEAALTLHREVRQFNDARARRGATPIAIGIGLNYGPLMLGTIGETERIETTVLADAVNIASRFEGLTMLYGATIIAGEAFDRALPDDHQYHVRPLGTVLLKGLSRAVDAHEIFDADPSDLLLHKAHTRESARSSKAWATIIAGEAFVRALPDDHQYHVRPLGTVLLKGLSRAVDAHEIFDADPSDLLLHKAHTRERFINALTAYRRGAFDESREMFGGIADAHSGDRAAAWLRDRSALLAETTDVAWDGVDRLESK